MGIYFSNQDKDLTAKGTSFYPPMVPGFSSTTDRSFMVGGSSGLTWPPSPIGDILTYSNKLTQTGLIRISVSKLTKGFIRIQTASLKNIMKATYESTKSVMQSLRNKPGANACYGIFN